MPASRSVLGRALRIDRSARARHLAVLRAKQLVSTRKSGNQVFYSVRDPLLFDVLDLMRRYAAAHVHDQIALLKQYRSQESRA